METIQTDLGDLLILAADSHQKLLQDNVDLRAEVDLLRELLKNSELDLAAERIFVDELIEQIPKAYNEAVFDAEGGLAIWENSDAYSVVHRARREREER
jgi:hypothetical protein